MNIQHKILVQKFGGTSVEDIPRIAAVAQRIIQAVESGYKVVVVVSAMGQTTDSLLKMAHEISDRPNKRETDMLLTAGERIPMALLSITLHQFGYDAVSFTGSQSGIITTPCHNNARILDIRCYRIEQALQRNQIVIVAGFQGVSESKEVTTLGRGGSDTTAVALAAVLHAERCQIFTDVEGVFSADPRTVASARKLSSLTYEEMLEIAYNGAGVLHPRAVEFAKKYHVPVEVLSSFSNEPGTIIKKEKTTMEQSAILAVTKDNAVCSCLARADSLEQIRNMLAALAENHIPIRFFHCKGEDVFSFIIHEKWVDDVRDLIQTQRNSIQFEPVSSVTLVGTGMAESSGVVAKIMEILPEDDIPLLDIYSTHLQISCIIPRGREDELEAKFHQNFVEANMPKIERKDCENGTQSH